MIILPSAYLPSVEYVAQLVAHRGECVVDRGEHFVKRSERNRARIMTSSGVMPLTVCVEDANRMRQAVRDVRIDYSKRWQHQHRVALESAYRSSAYFDYYFPRLERFYTEPFERLADYNAQLLAVLLEMLGATDAVPRYSEEYVVASEADVDLRDKGRVVTAPMQPYFQLFGDRLPFEPNLSVLDLLLCEGPAAKEVLAYCRV